MKINKKYYFIIIAIIIPIIFFYNLFFPHLSVFFTPDYGLSDLWHYNLPVKYFLSSSLKHFTLPLWSKDIATGFPLLAEGQIGTFYLPNLILFTILPFYWAFNFSYLVGFSISYIGMYLFVKELGLSKYARYFTAFSFSFSAVFIAHIHHFNFIQSLSLLPLLFYLSKKILDTNRLKYILFFAFILAQQIFTGLLQITFITSIGLLIYILTSLKKDNYKKNITLFFLTVVLGLIISGIQLIPTLELIYQSNKASGLNSNQLFYFTYPFKFLITFLLPKYFGTPNNGSYPALDPNLGIYWEQIGYLGILPIFLIIYLIINNKSLFKKYFNLTLVLIISLILTFGRGSPLAFIFKLPGFNLFRSPSRFIVLTTFSLSIFAGLGFDQFILKYKYKILPILLMILISIDLWKFGHNYHPIVSVNKLQTPPQIVNILKKLPKGRIYTTKHTELTWNKIMTTSGWQNVKPFLYFRNSLNANSNLFYDIPHSWDNSGMRTRRYQVYKNAQTSKLIDLSASKYIISTNPIINIDNLTLINTITSQSPQLDNYYLYKNNNSVPRIRLISDYQTYDNPQDFIKKLNQPNFDINKTVLLEKPINKQFKPIAQSDIKIIMDQNQVLKIQSNNDQDAILLVADSYYPGWKALIDNQETNIIVANINQRAIILPKGNHTIEFKYHPSSLYIGMIISLIGIIIWLYLWQQTSIDIFKLFNNRWCRKLFSSN